MQEISPMAINTIVPASLAGLPTPEPSAASGLRAQTPPSAKRVKRPLMYLADRIFGKPLCITKGKCEIILGALGPRLGLAMDAIPVVQFDGDEENEPEREYAVENGIACIPVVGTLVKRASGMDAMSGMTSYTELREQIGAAVADPGVKAICLDCDSPGGEAAGAGELSDFIYSARGDKPIYAVVNDQCCSAAYWLASAADKIYTTRDGMLGSIGVYILSLDQSEHDAAEGLKYTFIHAGDKKVDGNSHEPLSDSAKATLQQEVDRVWDMFVSGVARNRGVSADSLYALEADVRFAEGAIPLLADKLGTLDDAKRDMLAAIGAPEKEDPEEEQQQDEEDDLMEMVAAAPIAAETFATGGKITLRTYTIGNLEFAPAAPPPSTKAWDGEANAAKRLKSNQPTEYYRSAYGWQDPTGKETEAESYRFLHHEIGADGEIGPANVEACIEGIKELNVTKFAERIPAADRAEIYAHLANHLKDASNMLPFSEVRQEAIQSILTAREKGLYGHSIKECFHLISQAGQARWMDIEAADKARPVLAIRIFGTSEIIPARRAIPIDDKLSSYEQVPVADSRTIRCLVAPYNRMSLDLGGFREMYSIGCFAAWLASGADACAVLQHDPMYILGRQSADTAKFYETDTGLWFECEAPATQWASDLLTSMRRGDVTGSSAAFFIDHARWEYRNGTKIRIIEKARLVEGSIANFALYPDSTASVISPTSAAASVPAAAVATPDGHVNQLAAARLRLLRLA